jgi:hypothetical protein
MALIRNLPPVYNIDQSYLDNFDRFFDWAVSLNDPFRQIPEMGDNLGFGIRRHPIGFIAVYLSEHPRGLETICLEGVTRANIYPSGSIMKEDIHSHGFDFMSGVAKGTLVNVRHYPDWSASLPDGEGYVGYETSVDALGQNHTIQATNATVAIPRSEKHELQAGDTYTLKPREDFHSVYAGDHGAVTLFSKTTTYEGQDGATLVLRRPDQEATPEVY